MTAIVKGIENTLNGTFKTGEGISRFLQGSFSLLSEVPLKLSEKGFNSVAKLVGGRKSERLAKKNKINYSNMHSAKKSRKNKSPRKHQK